MSGESESIATIRLLRMAADYRLSLAVNARFQLFAEIGIDRDPRRGDARGRVLPPFRPR
jgi:hypothetical protein